MSAFLSVYVIYKMEQPSLLVTEKLHHKGNQVVSIKKLLMALSKYI